MISKKIAIKLMIGLLSIVLVFHFCVLFEIISYEKVWAGKLTSLDEMRVFETISIVINALMISIIIFKSRNLKNNETNKLVNVFLWVFVFLFAVNTVGNLFAVSVIERVLGTSLTFVSSLLCWIIVKKER